MTGRKTVNKAVKKKRKAVERGASRVENPSWLNESPSGAPPRPPIHARTDVLPFTGLGWENFERLCVRLAALNAGVVTAWAYGKSGDAQHGIDVLVRLTDGSYDAWQSKRHQTISKAKIKAAVDFFLKRKWSRQATRFTLAIACELSSPAVVEAIEAARDKLRERKIEFVPLGASQLTMQLVGEPELVDDFFGRPWVEAVCPPEAIGRLRQRLSRFDVAELKAGLRICYSSWISTVDPGLPIVGVDAHGRARATIPLPDRYTRAEFLVQSVDVETAQVADNTAALTQSNRDADIGGRESGARSADIRRSRAVVRERRLGLEDYLGEHRLFLVLGDAGTGKSTLLRFLALDILSDAPKLAVTRDRYKDLTPVWLPFALWARMSMNQPAPVAIEDAAAEFLRAQGGTELAEHMRRAVLGKRVVLLVDGIDEAIDPNTSQTLLAVLTAFVDRTGVPVIATSRPHGVRSLTGLGGAWERTTLAPLSDDQRHALANLWFSVLERFEADASASENQIRLRARRKADAFISALQGNAGIARLSQTPLFLLAFIGLHSRGQDLPRNRFAASKEIVEQLMEQQPSRRAVSALVSDPAQTEPRLRDRIICDFAFALQSGELAGRIPDAAPEDDAIVRGSRIILQRQNTGNQDTAEAAARAIFSFTEERAGLLVNKATGNIGFLHLSLQEYLAARHLVQFQAQEKLAFVSANAVTLRWREPILYLLAMTQTEAETGQLVEAIERAQPRNTAERIARDALLADAAFADFSHDLCVVRRIAANCLSELESTAWGSRQQHLLAASVEGLFSESVRNLCHDKLSEWLPDRHGYGRETALHAIRSWNTQSREAAIPALWRCLHSENDAVWRRAAQVLPLVCERRSDVKEKLLRLARRAPSVHTANAALLSVGFGWTEDEDVGNIARKLRDSDHDGLCLDAIRMRARRNETDADDLDRFFAIAYERDRLFSDSFFAPDLAEHFAQYNRETFAQKLETAISEQTGERHRVKSLIGALFLCNSESATARRELSRLLDADWMISEIFTGGNFPLDRVSWTTELTAKIEAEITDGTRYGDHDLYQISKVLPLPFLKQKFLDGVRRGEHLCFWYSRGLAEVWGRDDADVRNLFMSMLDADPKILSQVAQELPLMVDDRSACRAALLRGMRADVQRYDFLLNGCKNLGLTGSDEEMVQAALTAGERERAPLYRDIWCSNIILAFPEHPRVRTLATEELLRRDGSLGAVAQSYPDDPDMCQRVLKVLCPLDAGPRMALARALESAAISNASAYSLLMNVRRDTDGLVCAEGIMGGVEAMLTRGPIPDRERQWLVHELDTVGPEYEKRRMAAVIGLLVSGNIECFSNARDHRGQPLNVRVNPDLSKEDIYLRRLMPLWAEMSQALGGEAAVLERLGITPERSLSSVHAGIPNARRLFDLLIAQAPSARHLRRNDQIAALVEFAPRGPEMRGLLETMLRSFHGRTIGDITAILRAGQVFADYFRDDRDLRNLVMDAFNANPGNAMAAGALAELLLRENNPDLAESVIERVRQYPYDVGTNHKLMAVFASNEDIIRAVGDILAGDIEANRWAIPYWVPALVRRIATDATLQADMHTALTQTDSLSLRLSLWSLLGSAAGRGDDLLQLATAELRRLDEEIEPAIGFDLLTNSHRLLFQVLTEIVI